MTTRRSFLRLSGLAAFASTVIPRLVRAANEHRFPMRPPSANTILFQGDSITDAGRDRANYYPNAGSGMGGGYVHDIVTHLLGKFPERNYQFYNRGISGNKVFQLANRWDDDCLNLHPDVLSLLIGVNDYWHTLSGNYDGTVEVYEHDLRQLLDRTRMALPDVALIIGEPFAVAGGTAIDERWAAFDGYRAAARRVAQEYAAVFLPYHAMFAEALSLAPAAYWCPDGVHPSMAGCYLMKEAWLAGFSEM